MSTFQTIMGALTVVMLGLVFWQFYRLEKKSNGLWIFLDPMVAGIVLAIVFLDVFIVLLFSGPFGFFATFFPVSAAFFTVVNIWLRPTLRRLRNPTVDDVNAVFGNKRAPRNTTGSINISLMLWIAGGPCATAVLGACFIKTGPVILFAASVMAMALGWWYFKADFSCAGRSFTGGFCIGWLIHACGMLWAALCWSAVVLAMSIAWFSLFNDNPLNVFNINDPLLKAIWGIYAVGFLFLAHLLAVRYHRRQKENKMVMRCAAGSVNVPLVNWIAGVVFVLAVLCALIIKVDPLEEKDPVIWVSLGLCVFMLFITIFAGGILLRKLKDLG